MNAIQESLRIEGHLYATVKRALTGLEEIVIDQKNTIHADLKDNVRDTMNTNVDFALDNLQATQVAAASLSSALNGKDGIVIFDQSGVVIGDIIGFMASAVHPTDPSGTVYRQWQGVYQNLSGGTVITASAIIAKGYNHTGAPSSLPFIADRYASNSYADVTLLVNDIITINWKITVG